jgi:hypothetical protein
VHIFSRQLVELKIMLLEKMTTTKKDSNSSLEGIIKVDTTTILWPDEMAKGAK